MVDDGQDDRGRRPTRAKSVPLPTHGQLPADASQLDYYMDEVKNVLLNDDPNDARRPGRSARLDPAGRAPTRCSTGRAEDLHVVRPDAAVRGDRRDRQRRSAEVAVHRVARRDRQRRRRRARDRERAHVRARCSSTPRPKVPAARPVRRSRCSRSRPRSSAATRPNDRCRRRRCTGGSTGFRQRLVLQPRRGDCPAATPTLTERDRPSPTTARSCAPSCRSGPGNFGTRRCAGRSIADRAVRWGSTRRTSHPPVVSTTLGTNGVHPLEMAQAYSVLPNDGVLKRATFVTKIVDRDGKTIYQAPTAGTRVLDPNVARTETSDAEGRAEERHREPALGIGPRPAAGKTGTTDHNQDAWFVGYTPQFTAAVWMGNPLRRDPDDQRRRHRGVRRDVSRRRSGGSSWRPRARTLPPLDFAAPDETLWPTLAAHHRARPAATATYYANPAPDTTPDHRGAPVTATTTCRPARRRRSRAP